MYLVFILTLSTVICCGFFLVTNELIISRFGQKPLLNALNINVNVRTGQTEKHDLELGTNLDTQKQARPINNFASIFLKMDAHSHAVHISRDVQM